MPIWGKTLKKILRLFYLCLAMQRVGWLYSLILLCNAQNIIALYPKDTVVCGGDSLVVKAIHNGDSILWQPLGIKGDSIKIPLNADNIFLYPYLYASGSAVDSDTVHIRAIIARFTFSTPVCAGDTITFAYQGDTSSIIAWDWTFPGASPPSASGPGPHKTRWFLSGNYDVQLVVFGPGCTDTAKVGISVIGKPIIDAGPDKTYCLGTPGVILDGSVATGFTNCVYRWTPSQGLDDSTLLRPLATPSQTTTYYLQVICDSCSSSIDSVTVYVYERPDVEIPDSVLPLCMGESDTIFATATDGQPPYSYFWSPTAGLNSDTTANPIVNTDTSQFYFLFVVDANGCPSDTDWIYVQVYERPRIDLGPDMILCEGDPGDTIRTQVLNYNPYELEYVWVPPDFLNSANAYRPYTNPDTTITYVLIAIHPAAQCSSVVDSSTTITVYRVPRPVAHAALDDTLYLCQGDTLQLYGWGTNGDTNAFTYQWTPTLGLSNPNIANPLAYPPFSITYYFTVGAKGCLSDADSVRIEVLPPPAVVIDSVPVLCPGDTVALTGSIAPIFDPTYLTFTWTPSNGLSDTTTFLPLASPSTTTLYTLTVRYHGICPRTFPLLIRVFNDTTFLRLPSDTAICAGDTIVLQAQIDSALSNFAFQWRPPIGLSNPTNPTTLAYPLQSTTYTAYLIYASTSSQCQLQDSIRIYVNAAVDAQLSALPSDSLCEGEPVLLIAQGGIGSPFIQWYFNDSLIVQGSQIDSLLFFPDTSGWIKVHMKEGICSDQDTLWLTIHPAPQAQFTILYPQQCGNSTVQFIDQSQGAVMWLWEFGDGNISNLQHPEHHYITSGNYSVRLTVWNAYGCEAQTAQLTPVRVLGNASTGFILDDSVVYLPNATVLCEDTSKVYGLQERLWITSEGNVIRAQNPLRYTFSTAGMHWITLVLKDSLGCSDTIKKWIEVKPSFIEVANVFTPNGDGFNDVWRVRYLGSEPITVAIFDRVGRLVFEAQQTPIVWDGRLPNGKPAPEGTYFYVIRIGNNVQKGTISLIR